MSRASLAAPARPARREQIVFFVAAGVIAVHVLIDSFVTVAPGASRLHHVPGATLALAGLGLAAVFYRRLRPGLRAASALLFGVLALTGSVIVYADAVVAGLSGQDWTGFLVLPAALALLALGVWLLWVSRKKDRWRWPRRVLLAGGTLLAAYWVILPIALAMYATERPHEPVTAADLGRAAEPISIRTADGLTLTARYVPSRNGAAVIVYPGEWATSQARMLVAHSYGVLALDPRGYGGSQGDPNAFGWGQTRDIDAAVGWLRRRPDVDPARIGGLGISVGGEQMIDAAAGDRRLAAVVSEGAGLRSSRETFARTGVGTAQAALQWPYDAVLTAALAILSGYPPPPSLVDSSARLAPRAVFLILAGDGQEIEKSLNPAYFAAAGQPKEIWEVPGAAHTGGAAAQPREYERRMVGFFDAHLFGGE